MAHGKPRRDANPDDGFFSRFSVEGGAAISMASTMGSRESLICFPRLVRLDYYASISSRSAALSLFRQGRN